MSALNHKIDFAVVLSVKKANPNGDPLNGNRPRQDYEGFGEISDVAIKRKIRNRWLDIGETVFVQSNDRKVDKFRSLRERAESDPILKDIINSKNSKGTEADFIEKSCENWIDVRSFGQVFAYKGAGKGNGVSIGIRGPVSIHGAVSVEPIEISSMQITKSVNSETGEGKASDTMGMKHRVDYGVYVFYGSVNPQLAEKTNFSDADAEKLKEALVTLFENDASSARPEGSMEVNKVYWWKHESKLGQYSSAKVHRLLDVKAVSPTPKSFEDYAITLGTLEGLDVSVIDGK